jgi:hypothetical protein
MGRRGATPERAAAVEPDPGVWATTGRELDQALIALRSRRRDPCAERVAIELDRRRSPAERAAIAGDQADALKSVIDAVLDGIDDRGAARAGHRDRREGAAPGRERGLGMSELVLDLVRHYGRIVARWRSRHRPG